jgi:8-oxo-dGTP pyrophosphatase MutT (NUDIX family)
MGPEKLAGAYQFHLSGMESTPSRRVANYVQSNTVFAGAVIVAPGGRVLCQLRDDKPGILYPGYWSCAPGGHVEAGEEPMAAVVRELYEEFEVRAERLRRLVTIVENSGDCIGTYHAFVGQLVMPVSKVKCHEGVRVEFLALEAALALRQHPVSRKILLEFVRQSLHVLTPSADVRR